MNVLAEIVESKLARIDSDRSCQLVRKVERNTVKALPKNQCGEDSLIAALTQPGMKIIGEIKPCSPSSGKLLDESRLDALIDIYARNCAAISVLTDQEFFGGSFDLLSYVRKRIPVPVLCKDFTISERQIELAREHGASAILLIAKILTPKRLEKLVGLCDDYGIEPVVEINNEEELEISLETSARLILINNRDLDTMQTDLKTTRRLAPRVPCDRFVISASGVKNDKNIESLGRYCKNFLIGTALLQHEDPERLLYELLSARPNLKLVPLVEKAVDGIGQ